MNSTFQTFLLPPCFDAAIHQCTKLSVSPQEEVIDIVGWLRPEFTERQLPKTCLPNLPL